MLRYLKTYFGYDSFRPMQEEVINHILQKKDCLVLMPTGGGKSICFQIPALMMEGTAIVVSPLISLMKDQVEALRANGIPAAALNSNATEVENREIADKAFRGEYKLLYISPEKLLTEIEHGILRYSIGDNPTGALKVSMFAIDEAHCISAWGHDFRPEYTQLGKLREEFPEVPIAAFTATADKITKNDIVEQLRLAPSVLRTSPPSGEGQRRASREIYTLKTADPILYSKLREFSHENRNNPTQAEEILWNYLKGDVLGVRFRRQHVLDCFIVDYACLSHRLTIELDGGYHFTSNQQEYDKLRTEALKKLGFREIRFSNKEVLENLDDVLTKIKEAIRNTPLKGEQEGAVKVFVSSFDRPNLSLDVRRGYSAKDKLRFIMSLVARHPNESGIIYCLSRKTSEKVADDLRNKGILARAYHAGLSAKERDEVQEDFINDRINVVCATIAFGMGIDKSNVRYVVHYNLPKSIENYYQEIGRGGRDGLPCETILFYNVGDIITLRNFADESGQRKINNEKLDRMQEYAESQVCRRRILLNYFGENMDHDCDNCDVCKNPPQRFDGTVIVQKALSAISRTKELVGFRTTIDILRGLKTFDIVDKQYYKLKTFGVGHDISSRDWQDYLLQMLHLGYIEIDYKDGSHLKITPQGEDVLFGKKKADLAVITREDFSVKGRKQKIMEQNMADAIINNGPEDMVLFEKLRQLRMKVATEMGVPPYVVFSDRTLHELATVKPETIIAIGAISGIGTHKREQFGETFIKAIREHKGLSTNTADSWSNKEELTFEISSDLPFPEKKTKAPRDFITIKGVEYHIDQDILDCMKWRAAIEHVEKDIYYNLWQDNTYPMSRYVPVNIQNHDKVVTRFIEILISACKLTVSPDDQWIYIPKRIELDSNGNPVHTLNCTSFEDGLQQFRKFVDEHKHYPFAGSGEYECSLRRWYQEVQKEVIKVTPIQRLAFNALADIYTDVPKTKTAWEKSLAENNGEKN